MNVLRDLSFPTDACPPPHQLFSLPVISLRPSTDGAVMRIRADDVNKRRIYITMGRGDTQHYIM